MYSSLHNHTYYSLLDGYGSPKEMLDRAKEIGLKAFAITEHGNVYSHIYFDLIKKDYPDIKMIYGCELYECEDITVKDKDGKDAKIGDDLAYAAGVLQVTTSGSTVGKLAAI